MQIVASDYQEAKNINTESDSPLPNTRFQGFRAEAVPRPTVTWVTPEKGKCLGGASRAARGGERQRPDLVGRLLRRQAPDRSRSARTSPASTRRRGARAASARARTCSRPSHRTCAGARPRRLRPFASASDRSDPLREAASRRRHDRRRRGCEPVRQPLGRPSRRRVVGGSRLPGQAGRGSLGPRRLRRRRRAAARGGPQRALRRSRGRRRPGVAGWVRLRAGDPVPRLRPDRREPEAARRLLGHHGASRRDSPARRRRDRLRQRAHGRRRGRDDGRSPRIGCWTSSGQVARARCRAIRTIRGCARCTAGA